MKKLLSLALCTSVVIGISSCQEVENVFCYECTHPSKCDVDICDETVTPEGGACNLLPASSGSTNEEYRNVYEADGYTCRLR